MKIIATVILLSLAPSAWAESNSVVGTFMGTSATAQNPEKRFIEVKITERDSRFILSGGGGFSNGGSTAPDFSGSAAPTMTPPVKFSFEDSFGNKGTAFVFPNKTGISFSVSISEVKDSRCLPLYVEIKLTRKKS